MMKSLKAVKLPKEELKRLCVLMSDGNSLLNECAEMFKMDRRTFRGKLFNKKLDLSQLDAIQLTKLQAAIPAIMKVKEVCEPAILSGFKRLVMQQSRFAALNSSDMVNASENYAQEAMIGLLDAVYGYIDLKVSFMTYVWRIIRQRIHRSANKENPFKPLTNEALKLVRRFNDQKVRLTVVGPVSEQQVVDSLNLSSHERQLLSDVTKKMLSSSQKNDVNTELDGDYTSFRVDIDDVKETFVEKDEVRAAFKNANLSPIELELVFAESFPYAGWREDVASKHTNPKTGKRYTREVTNIINRAKDKIQQALLHPPEVNVENPEIDRIFDSFLVKE